MWNNVGFKTNNTTRPPPVSTTVSATTPESQARLSALAGMLEAKRQEARELGVEEGEIDQGSRTIRGRGGRGRGGRGRGRGGAYPLGRMTLDNRTSSFLLFNLPDGILNESILREHFSVCEKQQ